MMKFNTFSVLLVGILLVACRNDTSTPPLAVEQELDQSRNAGVSQAHNQDIDVLLGNGLRLASSFVLDPDLPSATIHYLEGNGEMESSLRTDGFDGPMQSLALVEYKDGTPDIVLLHIRTDGIFDSDGDRLVDQIPAVNGYAWRVGTSSADAPLSGRSFISVILLDENGAGGSDELYIYFKPELEVGGVFVVTNIPNELL